MKKNIFLTCCLRIHWVIVFLEHWWYSSHWKCTVSNRSCMQSVTFQRSNQVNHLTFHYTTLWQFNTRTGLVMILIDIFKIIKIYFKSLIISYHFKCIYLIGKAKMCCNMSLKCLLLAIFLTMIFYLFCLVYFCHRAATFERYSHSNVKHSFERSYMEGRN